MKLKSRDIKINYENKLNNEIKPLFYAIQYNISNVTTKNTLSLCCLDIHDMILKYNFNFYICTFCKLNAEAKCIKCKIFDKFVEVFITYDSELAYILPQPSIYSKRNFAFFKSFIEKISYFKLNQNEIVYTGKRKRKNVEKKQYSVFDQKKYYYTTFMVRNFRGGSLAKQTTGKYSHIRGNILGTVVNGIRATLTVDSSLLPNKVQINRIIYDQLNLAIPLVIVNRDPSLNSKCIYVCEIEPFDDLNDSTIHLNSFKLNGLHADQDGDDINLYFIEKDAQHPSYLMVCSMYEWYRNSWHLGFRHDMMYKCRYSFSQYHRYILYKYNKELNNLSPYWKSLERYGKNKYSYAMELGCSTHRNECDEFLKILTTYCNQLNDKILTYDELTTGIGSLKQIIDSGSKGSDTHLQVYLKELELPNIIDEQNNINKTKLNNITNITNIEAATITCKKRKKIMDKYFEDEENIICKKRKKTNVKNNNINNNENKFIEINDLNNENIHPREQIEKPNEINFKHQAILGFNKYINSSKEISTMGQRQFSLLFTFQNVSLFQNDIYINESIIFKDVNLSSYFSMILYQPNSVEYLFDSFFDVID